MEPLSLPRSPDNRAIFGSFVDYWDEVSYGQYSLTAGSKIINPSMEVNGNTVINWLTAPYDKSYYSGQTSSFTSLRYLYNSAISSSIANGWLTGSTDFDAYVIVYAGSMGGNGLWPCKAGNRFMIEERALNDKDAHYFI